MTPPKPTPIFISGRKDVPALVFDRSRPAALLNKLKELSFPASVINGGTAALYALFDGHSAFPLVSFHSREQQIIYTLSPSQKYVHLKIRFDKEHIISLPQEIAPAHFNIVSMMSDHLDIGKLDQNYSVTITGGVITSGGLRQPLEIFGKSPYGGLSHHERVLFELTSLLENRIGWDAIEAVYSQIDAARRWARLKDLMQE